MFNIHKTFFARTGFKVFVVLLFFSLPAGAAFVYSTSFRGLSPSATREEIVYPAAGFKDGQAQFFEHQTPEGNQVRYFVVQGRDGVMRAAFDACDVCWRDGKGLYQEGDAMVCRKCDQRFPISGLTTESPGCNPVPLAAKTRGDGVVIESADLRQGEQYFTVAGSAIGGPQCGGGGCGGGGGGCGGGGTQQTPARGSCCGS